MNDNNYICTYYPTDETSMITAKLNTLLLTIALLLCISPMHGQDLFDGDDLAGNEYMQPAFMGGRDALKKYIGQHLQYPPYALRYAISGQVGVRFRIDDTGRIDSVSVEKNFHPLLDSAAVRLVRQMPLWIPAQKNGFPKTVYYSLNIDFVLPADPNIVDGEKVYMHPTHYAEFTGGAQAMLEFIKINLLPDPDACYQVRIIVRLVIDREGKVKDAIVLRGIAKRADDEALRVVRMMPDWVPAEHEGEDVSSYYTLPVTFTRFAQ